MKTPLHYIVLGVFFLTACRLVNAVSVAPRKLEPSSTSTDMTRTAPKVTLAATSATRSAIAVPTAISPTFQDNPHWVIYEKAMSKAVINKDDGLCEWEILGISRFEIYMWVLCKARDWPGTAGSVPAVIHLSEDGEIKGVYLPRDGKYYPKDIRAMFPLEVQTKILHRDFGNCCISEDHIKARMISNGPPMIVILGTPLP